MSAGSEKTFNTKDIEDKISTFFKNTLIGSAKLLALSDFLIYDELNDSLDYYTRGRGKEDNCLEDDSETASDLRIAEIRMVAVKELIRQREAIIPLYYPYYEKIKWLKDRFVEAYIHENENQNHQEADEDGWKVLREHYKAILLNQNPTKI